jgi:hypothetical protein
MRNQLFQEIQTLRNIGWIWFLVIIAALGAFVPLAIGMYDQLFLDHAWGDKPMSDDGLIAFFIIMIIVTAIVAAVIYLSRLDVQIDEQGIRYKLFPRQLKWAGISPGEIATYEVRKLGFMQSIILKKGSRFLKSKQVVNLVATNQLVLQLKNGNKIIIGTNNPEGIEWAMKRLLERTVTL